MQTFLATLSHRRKSIRTLDLRSLAMMRIIIGCAIVRDLMIIGSTLSGLFGDMSVLPTSVALSDYAEQNYRSLHTISGSMTWQWILRSVHVVLAVLMIIGWKSRYVIPLLWIWICSIQGANPIITNGGDSVVRLVLFWMIWLPVSAIWSVDAIGTKDTEYKRYSVATIGLILQACHIYFWNYLLKTHDIWRVDHTAMYYALSLDPFAKSLGLYLYQFPELLKTLTVTRLYQEARGTLAYLLSHGAIRSIVVRSFIIAHIMMSVTLYIGAFPRYAVGLWIGLMPSRWRNWSPIKWIINHLQSLCTDLQTSLLSRYSSSSGSLLRKYRLGIIGTGLLIVVIVYCFMRNLRANDFDKREPYFPRTLNKFGFLARLDQYHSMFAPYPKTDDGRYRITGISTRDASDINITHPDRPPFDTKPTHEEYVTIVPHEKWRKLIDNLRQVSHSQYRQYFATYLCRSYNANATKYTRVKSINITYMREDTLPNYKTAPAEAVDLGTWECE